MRRFSQAFLTTAAVLVLLVNLVVIILYGRQFYACTSGREAAYCSGEAERVINYSPIVTMNVIILGTFLLIWLAFLYYRKHAG